MLYTQPLLRAEIERLRHGRPREHGGGRRAEQRASAASLRQRLQTAQAENRRLRAENAELRAELAVAYGHQRDAYAGRAAAGERDVSAATPLRPPGDGSGPVP